MNCLVIEAERRLLVIDCGVTFPDHEPGIDIIHPDFDFLRTRAADIEARGPDARARGPYRRAAVPAARLDVPVYGPPYALALVQERLREAELDEPPVLHAIQPRVAVRARAVRGHTVSRDALDPGLIGLVVRAPAGDDRALRRLQDRHTTRWTARRSTKICWPRSGKKACACC